MEEIQVKKTKQYLLGMPQLNFNGLDEIWLMKELGNTHWELLGEVTDMYSTNIRPVFVDVLFEFDQGSYNERDEITIDSSLFKIDHSTYVSFHNFGEANVKLISKFPGSELDVPNQIKPIAVIDDSLYEYREQRRLLKTEIFDDSFSLVKPELNPINVFNRRGALYCAEYIRISNMCNWLVNKGKLDSPIKKIRMMYFANMNPYDVIYGAIRRNEMALIVDNKPISWCEVER